MLIGAPPWHARSHPAPAKLWTQREIRQAYKQSLFSICKNYFFDLFFEISRILLIFFVNLQLNSSLLIVSIKQTDFYFFWLILLFHETDNHYQLSGISLFLYFWSKICQLNFPSRQNFPQKMDMFI